MNHSPWCTEQNRVWYPCFACHMESEKEKHGDNVQFFSGDTLTVEVAEDGRLNIKNPHEESYQKLDPEFWFNKVQWDIDQMPDDKKTELSDWYHSFKELYSHRVKLFIALCNAIIGTLPKSEEQTPWKSKNHWDGLAMFEWWFIAGIGYKKWETLTYHLPIEEWDNLRSVEIQKSPEFDGHTSEDVLTLLSKI